MSENKQYKYDPRVGEIISSSGESLLDTDDIVEELNMLHAQVSELRKDKEILDCLEKQDRCYDASSGLPRISVPIPPDALYLTLRSAITKVMKGVGKDAQTLAELEKARNPRIYTKCPACKNDTLTINDDKHLLCTWHECPNPTLIDSVGDELEKERVYGKDVKEIALKWHDELEKVKEERDNLRGTTYQLDYVSEKARHADTKSKLLAAEAALREAQEIMHEWLEVVSLDERVGVAANKTTAYLTKPISTELLDRG